MVGVQSLLDRVSIMFVKCQDVSQDLAAHGVVMIFFDPFFFMSF